MIAAARPLSEIVWMREVEGGAPTTPERRAALEFRLSTLTQSIQDEVVRKYYRQDLQQRLREMTAPAPVAQANYQQRGNFGGRDFGSRDQQNWRGNNQRRAPFGAPPPRPGARTPYQVTSPQLAQSPLMRGQRSALSHREALILQSLLNHPWLLHEHLEEVAVLEFANPEATRLRQAVVDFFALDAPELGPVEGQGERLRGELTTRGFGEILQRVERSITTLAVWGAQPDAAAEDVVTTWHQLVSLHRQWNSLTRELKDAETALGQDASEANYAWLRDIKSRLDAMDGTEAQVDGFGDSSGRSARTV